MYSKSNSLHSYCKINIFVGPFFCDERADTVAWRLNIYRFKSYWLLYIPPVLTLKLFPLFHTFYCNICLGLSLGQRPIISDTFIHRFVSVMKGPVTSFLHSYFKINIFVGPFFCDERADTVAWRLNIYCSKSHWLSHIPPVLSLNFFPLFRTFYCNVCPGFSLEERPIISDNFKHRFVSVIKLWCVFCVVTFRRILCSKWFRPNTVLTMHRNKGSSLTCQAATMGRYRYRCSDTWFRL